MSDITRRNLMSGLAGAGVLGLGLTASPAGATADPGDLEATDAWLLHTAGAAAAVGPGLAAIRAEASGR